jgi:hypothetical protein
VLEQLFVDDAIARRGDGVETRRRELATARLADPIRAIVYALASGVDLEEHRSRFIEETELDLSLERLAGEVRWMLADVAYLTDPLGLAGVAEVIAEQPVLHSAPSRLVTIKQAVGISCSHAVTLACRSPAEQGHSFRPLAANVLSTGSRSIASSDDGTLCPSPGQATG